MDINELNQMIPYKWKIQAFSEYKTQARCVAYIDARDAQNLLDKVCGKENWQAEYYEVGKMLFCKVGIKINNEWIWKSDTGKESRVEKEKGHCSDAFKRACVVWGVSRFLYHLDIKYVDSNVKKVGNNSPYVVDYAGKRVWDLTTFINNKKKEEKLNIVGDREPYI